LHRKQRGSTFISIEKLWGISIPDSIFDKFLNQKRVLVKNKQILQSSYIPDELPHRQEQVDQIASVLVTALRGDRPSNIMIFGKTGTGKTAAMKYLGKELKRADTELGNVEFIYMNCEVVDTQYGVLQNIGNQIILDFEERIPFTGWSTEKVYNSLMSKIDEENKVFIVVLDEIDKLFYKSGDDVLYHLSKMNEDLIHSKLSLVGISNDLKFTEFMDQRVRSRLGEEKMVFPPYNAEQLQDILSQRALLAFEDDVIDEGVIPFCAALSAQEMGDARRALDLLRIAADIAERNNDEKIMEAHVKKAKNKIELDAIAEAVKTLPTQSKLVLMAIIMNDEDNNKRMTTGDVYSTYKYLVDIVGMSQLTQRRITDLISELDMLGIIHARVRSFGRGGRTKEIEVGVPINETKALLHEDEILKIIRTYRPPQQTTLI
jgi:cell division control protein 6